MQTNKRYTFKKIGHHSGVITYKYGKYLEIQCNSSNGRTIIINEIDDSHIPDQFDRVFGLGEYKKARKHLVTHNKEKNTNNPHSVRHTIIVDYIPKLAKKDIKDNLPDDKKDLIGKYFK
jgi:hypothetical protein